MKKFCEILLLVSVITSGILCSCYAQATPYNTVIRNTGTKKFSDSMVTFSNRSISAGWVSPGNYKVNVRPSIPLSDKVVISWRREGKLFAKELLIKGNLPKIKSSEEYYLVFNIDDSENARLKVVICDQSEPCINKW